MLKVALAQLNAHKRRFIAVTLAVMLGVGFLSATLLVRSSTEATLEASIGAAYPTGAVIVEGNPDLGNQPQRDTLEKIRALPSVGSAASQPGTVSTVQSGTTDIVATVRSVPEDPALRTVKMVSGELPSADSQIVIDKRTADQYSIATGDVLSIPVYSAGPGTSSAAQAQGQLLNYTVTGIAETTSDPRLGVFGMVHMSESGMSRFSGDSAPIGTILVAPAAGVNADQLAAEIQTAIGPDYTSRTSQAQTAADVAAFSGGSDQLTPILLLFAGLALVVTMLVISNTFSVLVAQRTRELALLRTLGAQGSQVQRSVLVEALIVGLLASVLGVLLAIGTVAALIAWAQSNPDFAFATLRLDTWALTVPIAVGVLITVIAASIPARRATRIAPLAALRPVEEATLKTRAGRTRLTVGVIATLVGLALLALGWLSGMLVIAFFGGLISFVGILMAAQLFMPGAIAGVGKLLGKTGVPAKLAALNSVRNPGRTTATATALLIGATLVSMMIVGAQTAKSTMDTALKGKFPVDLSISIPLDNGTGTNNGMPGVRTMEKALADAQTLRGIEGITGAAVLQPVGQLNLQGGSAEDSQYTEPLYVLNDSDASILNDSAIDISKPVIWASYGTPASSATVTGTSANPGSIPLEMTSSNTFGFVMGQGAAAKIGLTPEAAQPTPESANSTQIWVKTAPGASTNEIMELRQTIADTINVPAGAVSGAVIERALFMQIIDVLLLIVLALLAVAVVISIIGVANTLSLSVLERTQENALLRALGLTRGQLRGMLALEALLISVVSAALGMVLGGIYGAVGAGTALVELGTPVITVPWAQFGLILLVAVLAGLLASLMPARRAARLSPVQGLATE
ncbi:ABC transporter permease [Haematomicrobium sanguinis]|uniref:ABC transporter permease n=1 Tax=Haematomicrobium sanguinis TaxID=479106 RepID=UPI00047A313E|nr:FtsX-like permease family protein [Haematomicrobium sanguinis]